MNGLRLLLIQTFWEHSSLIDFFTCSYKRDLDELNSNFPSYSRVKQFLCLPKTLFSSKAHFNANNEILKARRKECCETKFKINNIFQPKIKILVILSSNQK